MKKEKSSIIKEFKTFISRGNVVDLAVGIIIGSAFTSIVNSLVNDVIMPVVGIIIGGIDFTSLEWVISPATETAGAVTLKYGNFIQSIVNFFIIAVAVFMMVKALNAFRKKKQQEPQAPKEPSEDIVLLREIRDLMKGNKESYEMD